MSRRLLLIRHGRPEYIPLHKSMNMHIQAYDQADIDLSCAPPKRLWSLLEDVTQWYCSPLPRAISSLTILKPVYKPVISTLFREAPLPLKDKPAGISLKIWLAWLRGRWIQGVLSAQESYDECLERSKSAVDYLLSDMKDKNVAAVMGHGFFNYLMARECIKRGWKQKASTRGYWSVRIMIEKQ